MKKLRNWDKKTWISSKKYINEINKFIVQNSKLNKYSRILDIGCGRGKIVGQLKYNLKLNFKPIGIDEVKHKDLDKRIIFKRNISKFFKKNSINFDLILIKQTIHLFKKSFIKSLLNKCIKSLKKNGIILIINIDSENYKLPLYKKINLSFNRSLLNNKKKLEYIKFLYPNAKAKKFTFKVIISKREYLRWIKNRFMTCLLTAKETDIKKNIDEIRKKFKRDIFFEDNLLCFILKAN